jgi:uncharacterized surface protein with fasciclin (FAS1) repeats
LEPGVGAGDSTALHAVICFHRAASAGAASAFSKARKSSGDLICILKGKAMNLNHARIHCDETHTKSGSPRRSRQLGGGVLLAMVLGFGLFASQARAADILEVIDHDPAYSTFSSLLRKTGIAADLKSGAGYTVFVPSNAAFAEMTEAQRQQLFATDSAAARRALENLVITKRYLPQDIAHNRLRLTSVSGRSVLVDGTEGRLTADGTEILSVDTSPSNGVIYTIDDVNLSHPTTGRDAD